MSTMRHGQNNWLGHVLRGNSLLKTALEGRMVGKKTVDRPRVMLLDWIFDKRNNWTYQHLKGLAQNRDAWRRWNPRPA